MSVETAPEDTPLVRRVLLAIGSAWMLSLLGNLFVALFDPSRVVAAALTAALLLLGGAIGWREGRGAGPWPAGDLRDGAVGWGIVVAIVVATGITVALPMPWAGILGVVAFVLVGLFAVNVRGPHPS